MHALIAIIVAWMLAASFELDGWQIFLACVLAYCCASEE